jgi:hypothetical protein
MNPKVLVGVVLLGAWVASTASASERSGADIFATTCAACHGSDGRGASVARTGLTIKLLDFTDCARTNREPDHDWHAVIAEGGPARGFDRLMPAFGEILSANEQEAVLSYARGFCADPVWPRGDLNFPRALVTEKAFIEDEVVVTSAMGTRSPRNVDSRLVFESRFLRRQQFEMSLPFNVARMSDGSRDAGIGDVSMGVKSMLLASLSSGTVLSVAGEVILPTGNKDKGFGKGVVLFEPFVALGQALPLDSFASAQAGVEIPTKEASGVETEGYARVALGRTFVHGSYGRSFTPMVEASAVRELAGGATTALDVVPQMQFSLSRRQHVLASLGGSIPVLAREGRSSQVMFYLLWDYADGGLFQAW